MQSLLLGMLSCLKQLFCITYEDFNFLVLGGRAECLYYTKIGMCTENAEYNWKFKTKLKPKLKPKYKYET